jgi:hypothetical protein
MRPQRKPIPLIGGSSSMSGTSNRVTINNVKAGIFRSNSVDGRSAGRVDVSLAGRCVCGLERIGIVGTDKVGRCSAG